MMSVDVIGDIRRAYFKQRLPIKEIVRTLCVFAGDGAQGGPEPQDGIQV